MAAWNHNVLSPDERERLCSLESQIESVLDGLSAEGRQAVLNAAMDTIHAADKSKQEKANDGKNAEPDQGHPR